MRGHTGTIRSVAFSSGNRGLSPLLASAGAGDNSVRLWDVATGKNKNTSMTRHSIRTLQYSLSLYEG